MNFVLDASVTISWLFEDQADRYTNSVLESLQDRSALVPVLWNYEVANALVVAQKRKLISATQSSQFLDQLRNLNILIQNIYDLKYDELLVHLGEAYGLTAYDSAYLKMSMSQGLPIATRDEALKRACVKAGVSLYKP